MLRIIILTVVLGLVFYFSPQIGLSQYLHTYKWIILAFFFAVSYLNHLLAQMGFANNRENFVQFYLGGIVARLILSLIFVGVIAYMGTKDIYIFITNFLYSIYVIQGLKFTDCIVTCDTFRSQSISFIYKVLITNNQE